MSAPVAGGGVDVLAVMDRDADHANRYRCTALTLGERQAFPVADACRFAKESDAAYAAVAELIAFARRVLTVHRGQLPSEIADMYGGGCGCPLCEQALAALSNIEGAST